MPLPELGNRFQAAFQSSFSAKKPKILVRQKIGSPVNVGLQPIGCSSSELDWRRG